MTFRDDLALRGYAVIPSLAQSPDDPWAYMRALCGDRPAMVERQPIRPIAGARSFAGGNGDAPLHTDSQDYLGAPPGLQIMVCRRAAERGGITRLVDGDALLARIARTAPRLHRELRTVPRLHRFYFGDVTRPTVIELAGRAVWTHSPLPPADPIGEALAQELAHEPVIELAVRAGQTLLVDNHRMLHGRTAFADPAREFVRLLAWFEPRAEVANRLGVVLELLAGAPPAKLAAREGISEAELYAWRTRALAAARSALDKRGS